MQVFLKKVRSSILLKSVFIILLLSGCSTIQPEIDASKQVIEDPTKKVTRHTEILKELGKMYRAYYPKDDFIYIQSKPVTNDTGTGGLPFDLTRMIISAINKMGKPIVYVPYDPEYFSNEYNTGGGKISRTLPKYVISGAITEYDKGVMTKGGGINADIFIPLKAFEADASFSKDNNETASRLTLDMQMLDYQTQTMISNAQSINTINIYSQSKSKDVGFSIFGSGFGMNGSVSRKQGTNAALRLLVESSLFELIAKEAMIPYWKISKTKVDKDVLDGLYEYYSSMNIDDLIVNLQDILINKYKFNLELTGKYDHRTKNAMKILCNDLGIRNCTSVDANLLTNVWINIPYKRSDKYYNMKNVNSNYTMNNTISAKVTTMDENIEKMSNLLINYLNSNNNYKVESFVDINSHVRTELTSLYRTKLLDKINALRSDIKIIDENIKVRSLKRKKIQKRKEKGFYTIKGYLKNNESNSVDIEIILLEKNGQVKKRFSDRFTLRNKFSEYSSKQEELNSLIKNTEVQTEMRNNVISFSTNKGEEDPIFYSGESVNFNIRLSKPLYVYVFNIDKQGNANLLFEADKKLNPDYNYLIPSPNDDWEIIVEPPFGNEAIKVFASEEYIEFPNTSSNVTRSFKKRDKKNKRNGVVQLLRETAKSRKINYYEKSILLETKN